MYNESYDFRFPRTKELIADATIVPEPRTLGWFGRLIRHREKGGTIVWNKDDNERGEMMTTDGLYYNPRTPPAAYYVLPEMYAPSKLEEEQIYAMGEIAVYETEQYRDQFYTDIGTCEVYQGEDDDDRLYYKEFSKLETEVDFQQANYESLQKHSAEEFNIEPHIAPAETGSAVCREETGQCSCSKKRAAALEDCKKNKSCDEKELCSERKLEETEEVNPPLDAICYAVSPTPAEKAPSSPSTILTAEQEEKLYISVDTHTDNTVVESRSMQTFKDEQNCVQGTQTATATSETSNSSKKRTYSITGQMKGEEEAAVDKEAAKLRVGKYKSKSSKGEPIYNLVEKPGSSTAAAKKK